MSFALPSPGHQASMPAGGETQPPTPSSGWGELPFCPAPSPDPLAAGERAGLPRWTNRTTVWPLVVSCRTVTPSASATIRPGGSASIGAAASSGSQVMVGGTTPLVATPTGTPAAADTVM